MYLHELKAALKSVIALAQAQVANLENTASDLRELDAKKHALSVVENHLADFDSETDGLTTLIKTARHALAVQLPFSAEEALALKNKQQEVDREIRLAKCCVGIVSDMLTKYGALVTDDEEINGGDVVNDLSQWVIDAQSIPKQGITNQPIQTFQGFIRLGSEFHQLDFVVPMGASVEEKDAAMMAALAQVAEIDYVSIGESSEEVLPGAPAAEILDIMMSELVGDYDVPEQVPEWSWVEQNASFNHVSNGQAGVWEFVINLALTFSDVPDRLKATIDDARRNNISYLIFHQGT